MRAATRHTSHPIAVPPDHMDGRNVGSLGYSKTGIGMRLLREHVLGHERFDRAFQEYIRDGGSSRARSRRISSRTMEDAAGMDLAWFWRQWFYETGILDIGITSVSQEEGTLRFIINSFGEQVMPVDYEITYARWNQRAGVRAGRGMVQHEREAGADERWRAGGRADRGGSGFWLLADADLGRQRLGRG